MNEAVSQTVSRLVLRWLRTVGRFPHFDEHKLERIIATQAKSEREKCLLANDLSELKRGHQGRMIFLVLATSIVYSVKYFYFVARSLTLFSYTDSSSNVHYSNHSKLAHMACMTTNCSRLSSDQDQSLADDLAKMPVFAICEPLAHLYPFPFKYLERSGLYMSLIFAFALFANGFVIPVAQLISPRFTECCLLAQAPHIATALTRDRLISIASRLCMSRPTLLSDSQRNKKYRHDRYKLEQPQPLDERRLSSIERRNKLIRNLIQPQSNFSAIRLDDKLHMDAMASWLPVTRSEWFRRKSANLVSFMVLQLLVIDIITTYLTVVAYLGSQLTEKSHLFQEFDRQMQSPNGTCSIWRHSNDHHHIERDGSSFVQPASINLSWSYLGILEFFGSQFLPSFMGCMCFLLFYMSLVELNCSQSEVQNQLMFLVEFKRLSEQLHCTAASDRRPSRMMSINAPPSPSHRVPSYPQRSPDIARQQQQQAAHVLADLTMKQLQEEFERANEWSYFAMGAKLVGGSNSRRDSTLAFQNLAFRALEMIRQLSAITELKPRERILAWRDQNRTQVEAIDVHRLLMERVYLNFCLYLDLMHHFADCLGFIISIAYFLLYGLIFMTIWYLTKISVGQYLWPIATLGFMWAFTNQVLVVCSAIHARGKGLHKLIWSLIAQFAGTHDPQMNYWIHLWRTQVVHLDAEKGIALRTLGFRVTYVRMVQLIIWAATMFVFLAQS